MRRAQVGIAALVVLIPLILFFQNCSEQGMPKENGVGFRDGVEYAVGTKNKAVACEAQAAYKCRVYRYAPHFNDGESRYQSCLIDEDFGAEICAEVEEITYDSSKALQLCADCRGEDGRPGGKFHYAEIRCQHIGEAKASFVVIPDAEVSVEGSLYEAVRRCRGK